MSKERAGTYKKNLSGEQAYLSFTPAKLPPQPPIKLDHALIDLLVQAHRVLAVLDEKAENIPDMNLFMSMYVQKEALLSSQIEGTQATLEDLFDPRIERNVNADVNDVVNYTKATNYAIDRLKTLPLCNRLLLETHKVLLSGVRGKEKNPGEFRRSQNWIGGAGSTIQTARYIPPDVDTMKGALSDLEKYMNTNDEMDHLIRAALIHYQFESIHPFLDGNGRIGRLLIVLYLLEKKIIKTPSLYISYYLKQHRIEYYDRMTAIRDTGNYEQWIAFFLEGIIISASSALETSDQLIALKRKNMDRIMDQKYSKRALVTLRKIFEYLHRSPIIEIGKTAEEQNLSYNTVSKIVQQFVDLKILNLLEEKERNRVYVYQEYLDVLRNGTEPL